MTLTTYRVDFVVPRLDGNYIKPLIVTAHRFDTLSAAVRYHLKANLGAIPASTRYGMTTRTAVACAADGSVLCEISFSVEAGPTNPEVGANAELAGTTHCPTCGSPEWNPVNVECEDCAAEIEKFDGLLDILEEYDVHVVDEVDDNPEKNPRVGFVPFDSTGLPERLLAWRDEAVKAAVAKESSRLNGHIDELEADLERRWLNSLGDITISAGFGADAVSVTVHNAEWAQLESHWQLAGWIRESAAEHWAIHEADRITVAYNPEATGDPDILLETVDLLRHAMPGTRYGDGRGAFTRFAAKRRPRRFGGEG